VSRYSVYITPGAWTEVEELPGHIRQRVRHAIRDLAKESQPANSQQLSISGIQQEVRRIRLDKWRIIYAITESDNVIDVLAIRKRPPYDYGDLAGLLQNLR